MTLLVFLKQRLQESGSWLTYTHHVPETAPFLIGNVQICNGKVQGQVKNEDG